MILKRLGPVHAYTRPTDTPALTDWRQWAYTEATNRGAHYLEPPALIFTPLLPAGWQARPIEEYLPTIQAIIDGLCSATLVPADRRVAALIIRAPRRTGPREKDRHGMRVELQPGSRLGTLLGD